MSSGLGLGLEFIESKGAIAATAAPCRSAVPPKDGASPARSLPVEMLDRIFSFAIDAQGHFSMRRRELIDLAVVCKQWAAGAADLRAKDLIARCFPSLPQLPTEEGVEVEGEGDIRARYRAWEALMVRNLLAGRFPLYKHFPPPNLDNPREPTREIYIQRGGLFWTAAKDGEGYEWRLRDFKSCEMLRGYERGYDVEHSGLEGLAITPWIAQEKFFSITPTAIRVEDLTDSAQRSSYPIDKVSCSHFDFRYAVSQNRLVIATSSSLDIYDHNRRSHLGSVRMPKGFQTHRLVCHDNLVFTHGSFKDPRTADEIHIFNLQKMAYLGKLLKSDYISIHDSAVTSEGVWIRVQEIKEDSVLESLQLLKFSDLFATPTKKIIIDQRDHLPFRFGTSYQGSNLLRLGAGLLVLGAASLAFYNEQGERRQILGVDEFQNARAMSFQLFDGILRVYRYQSTVIELNLRLQEGLEPDFPLPDYPEEAPLQPPLISAEALQQAAPAAPAAAAPQAPVEAPQRAAPAAPAERSLFDCILDFFSWLASCVRSCLGMEELS
ncbi:MAG: hypothetical protein HYX48_06965 [Chlamydiales bacterium]|nr:hypothetical protein [Chlamydiales bacterium]